VKVDELYMGLQGARFLCRPRSPRAQTSVFPFDKCSSSDCPARHHMEVRAAAQGCQARACSRRPSLPCHCPAQGVHVTALREMKLLRELQHPNVIALRDVFPLKKNIALVGLRTAGSGLISVLGRVRLD